MYYKNPKCYASSLDECSDQISEEHFISKSILTLWNEHCAEIYGFPWIEKGKTKTINITSLKSNILCSRHNKTLSNVDKAAFLFFKNILGNNALEEDGFDGHLIERWFLKLLIGIVASGNAENENRRITGWKPTREWLLVLFGCLDMPEGWGLHFVKINTPYHALNRSMHIQPVFKTITKEPIAISVALEGFAFLFSMEELPPLNNVTGHATTLYHPSSINITREGKFHKIILKW